MFPKLIWGEKGMRLQRILSCGVWHHVSAMKTSNSTHLYLFSTEEKGKREETVMYIRRIVATL